MSDIIGISILLGVPIAALFYPILSDFVFKSDEQKEIEEQREELDQLIKYRDYQRELSNINQERESVLKDIEGLDESNDEKLKRWKFEYMDVPEPKGVDPEPFMRQFMSGQSTKKAGEECNRAIPPHVKPYIHPSLTTHDNFSRQKNDDQQKALNILLEDMKHEKL